MPDFGVYPIGSESMSQDESESTFENKSGLAEDLKFLASMPELCDVTFLVGITREPVCAVKVSRLHESIRRQVDQIISTHAGHSRSSITHLPQNALPTASLTPAQDSTEPATRSRKQTSPLPQAIIGASAEPPKRVSKGTKPRFHLILDCHGNISQRD
jgi:hypothetical protein